MTAKQRQPGKPDGNRELLRALRKNAADLRTRFQAAGSPAERQALAIQLRAVRNHVRRRAKR